MEQSVPWKARWDQAPARLEVARSLKKTRPVEVGAWRLWSIFWTPRRHELQTHAAEITCTWWREIIGNELCHARMMVPVPERKLETSSNNFPPGEGGGCPSASTYKTCIGCFSSTTLIWSTHRVKLRRITEITSNLDPIVSHPTAFGQKLRST